MLAFAPSRGAGVREIESLDLCLFLLCSAPIHRLGGWRCLPVATVQMLGGVVVVVCPTISNPDATKIAVILFWMVCLQHPCCAFFF